jgi:aminoglycoside 6'-N-acetyltransferase
VIAATLRLRSLRRQDFALLSQWLAAPHVHTWWREDFDALAIERRYGPVVDGTDKTECFIVERHGTPIGFAQRYLLEDNPEWQTSLLVTGTPSDGAGIDYLIGSDALVGLGLGPILIDQLVEDTWRRYPHVTAVVVDVSTDNRRSWRALEKAGFVRTWSGPLVSDDPSDTGVSHVYVRHRPDGPPSTPLDQQGVGS